MSVFYSEWKYENHAKGIEIIIELTQAQIGIWGVAQPSWILVMLLNSNSFISYYFVHTVPVAQTQYTNIAKYKPSYG